MNFNRAENSWKVTDTVHANRVFEIVFLDYTHDIYSARRCVRKQSPDRTRLLRAGHQDGAAKGWGIRLLQ